MSYRAAFSQVNIALPKDDGETAPLSLYEPPYPNKDWYELSPTLLLPVSPREALSFKLFTMSLSAKKSSSVRFQATAADQNDPNL